MWSLAVIVALSGPLFGDEAFLTQATELLDQGRLADAGALAQGTLATHPDDPDALVVAGTVELYTGAQVRRDESIFRPEVDPWAPGQPTVSASVARRVAALWGRVPVLDPSRTSLWTDLIELTFRSGATDLAVDYARRVLADPAAGATELKAAATVFVLNLEAGLAAQALARIPGDRSYRLYRGLEAWRGGKAGWKADLDSFVADGTEGDPGRKLAAYLVGPKMRDTEAGYQAALQAEEGLAGLVVRQKWVDRYPDQFFGRFGLARALLLWGNYPKALVHYGELERRGAAPGAEEREAIVFHRAWALEASDRGAEALVLWSSLITSRDFYLRSAASWFVGSRALAEGKVQEARALWTQKYNLPPKPKAPAPEPLPAVSEEPARSKYAAWAAQELQRLEP